MHIRSFLVPYVFLILAAHYRGMRSAGFILRPGAGTLCINVCSCLPCRISRLINPACWFADSRVPLPATSTCTGQMNLPRYHGIGSRQAQKVLC